MRNNFSVSRYLQHCVPGQIREVEITYCDMVHHAHAIFFKLGSLSILLRVIVAQKYQLALPCGVFPVRRRKAGRLYFPYFGYVIVAEN